MANIKIIHEHSLDVDLLTGGICIDVGCRGFAFSEVMRDFGCEVWAFDLEDMSVPYGINYVKMAISNWSGNAFFKETADPQAKYLITGSGRPVDVLDINDLYAKFDGKEIDVLKLDCEGEEYRILSDENFKPIPKQISVEFHLHCHSDLHDQYFGQCYRNLEKHYWPVQHEMTRAHGAGWNFWNSLFIRRDLLTNIIK